MMTTEIEKYARFFLYKACHIIIQARTGSRQLSSIQSQSELDTNEQLVNEIKQSIGTPSLVNSHHFAVDIWIEQESKLMPIETWCLSIIKFRRKPQPNVINENEPDITPQIVYKKLSMLLKSIVGVSRSLPAYNLVRRSLLKDVTICYAVHPVTNEKPPVGLTERIHLDGVQLNRFYCVDTVTVLYRAKLTFERGLFTASLHNESGSTSSLPVDPMATSNLPSTTPSTQERNRRLSIPYRGLAKRLSDVELSDNMSLSPKMSVGSAPPAPFAAAYSRSLPTQTSFPHTDLACVAPPAFVAQRRLDIDDEEDSPLFSKLMRLSEHFQEEDVVELLPPPAPTISTHKQHSKRLAATQSDVIAAASYQHTAHSVSEFDTDDYVLVELRTPFATPIAGSGSLSNMNELNDLCKSPARLFRDEAPPEARQFATALSLFESMKDGFDEFLEELESEADLQR